MISFSAVSYTILGIISSISILNVLREKKSILGTIFINIILGGILYIVLNILKIDLPFNFLSASCITILGAPGILLLAFLKLILITF